ncbi:hypothetical protein FHS40_008805 [Streptomyces spectabilis]|uniref:Uncharacterized protein n=1 Tax=Streptomyces spectabilis TaxID=68270 RepID=A0A7W8F0E4_STRST|nr:hypothetical protein [Streptomyces spectabilis]
MQVQQVRQVPGDADPGPCAQGGVEVEGLGVEELARCQ